MYYNVTVFPSKFFQQLSEKRNDIIAERLKFTERLENSSNTGLANLLTMEGHKEETIKLLHLYDAQTQRVLIAIHKDLTNRISNEAIPHTAVEHLGKLESAARR